MVDDADVELAAVDLDLDLAVLRAAALDDVHVGHDLDAADERRRHRRRAASRTLVQRAVGADADAHAVLLRLDVHVGGAVAHRLFEDEVDDLDDRRVLVDLDRRGVVRVGVIAATNLGPLFEVAPHVVDLPRWM